MQKTIFCKTILGIWIYIFYHSRTTTLKGLGPEKNITKTWTDSYYKPIYFRKYRKGFNANIGKIHLRLNWAGNTYDAGPYTLDQEILKKYL